jgi:hypothetical protein
MAGTQGRLELTAAVRGRGTRGGRGPPGSRTGSTRAGAGLGEGRRGAWSSQRRYAGAGRGEDAGRLEVAPADRGRETRGGRGPPGARTGGSRAWDEGRTRVAWSSHHRYVRGRGMRGGTQGRLELVAAVRGRGTRGGRGPPGARTGGMRAGEGRGEDVGILELDADSRTRDEGRNVGRDADSLIRAGTLMQCGMGN